MNPNVSITNMNINGREFILAEVIRGMGQIGMFRYNSTPHTATDIFYVEKEPIIKVFNSHLADENHNKSIYQISGAEKASDFIKTRLAGAIDNFYNYNQELARSVIPVLEMLTPGLYVIHESQMHPCDGSGNFFWNAYGNVKEIHGSADKNVNIGNKNFSPCFLVPSHQPASFQPKVMYSLSDKFKGGIKQNGIAYHLTGMFSVLLAGHHAATAALINDSDFRCLVIEPLTEVVYSEYDKASKSRKIVAVSCPFIKIPLEQLSENMLEKFLIKRRHIRPGFFSDLKVKLSKTIRTVSKKAFPLNIYKKVEQLPEVALIESASDINYVTEEQLTALLAGNVKVDEEDTEYIVSANFHETVVAVASFLQVNDLNRFLDFAVDVLKNEELSAVHKYIAERLLVVMHPKSHEFFSEIAAKDLLAGHFAEEDRNDIIVESAHKYMTKWEELTQRNSNVEDSYHKANKKKIDNMKAIAEAKGIHTLEAAVRDIGGLPKGVSH
jgi:hypothetical protein